MADVFRLFWLRENGHDLGTPLRATGLEPELRARVTALAGPGPGEVELRLPFMNLREWRRRDQIFKDWKLEKRAGMIACALSPAAAARDLAATLVLSHPGWLALPREQDLEYFPTWQRVSLALQAAIRRWAFDEYFRDCGRFADRETAYPVLLYGVARLCRGRPRNDFTYDLRDYPDCGKTLEETWRNTGRALRDELAAIEARLKAAGEIELARRYRPAWEKEVLQAVQKKPRIFVELLSAESSLINSIVDLGTRRDAAAINRFGRRANFTLDKVYGMDLRPLAVSALEEATRILTGGAMAVRPRPQR